MSQFPFMPLFIDAYLADTTHFSAEEHGAYLLLLMAMWRRNGSVPNDDRDLARICCVNVRRWPRVKARLLPLLTEKNGELSQKRLYAVLDDLRNRKAQKRSSDTHTKTNDINDVASTRARASPNFRKNNVFSTELYLRDGNGSAAIGPSPAVEGRSGPTPIPGARRPDKPWPPPSQLIPRVYPNGKPALDPLPGAPEKPKKETRQ